MGIGGLGGAGFLPCRMNKLLVEGGGKEGLLKGIHGHASTNQLREQVNHHTTVDGSAAEDQVRVMGNNNNAIKIGL